MRLACLLLAAGDSKRFGGCKQLAALDGKPLLRHGLDALAPLFGADLYAVLGARRAQVEAVIGDNARILYHQHWRQGLGSSIAAGVGAVGTGDRYDGILLALADQPRIATADYRRLLDRFDGERIVAAYYAGRPGVPALFPRFCFDSLKRLEGDRGARALLRKKSADILQVPLPAAAFDVDTAADLRARPPARTG